MKSLQAVWHRVLPLRIGLVLVLVFVAGFALGNQHSFSLAQGDTSPPPDVEADFEAFWQVFNLIDNSYLDRDQVTTQKLVDGAIKGMIDSLGDQFSGYMDPETYPLLNADLSGEVEGIGAVVETDEETNAVRIVNVLEGSPAEAVGIKAGDVFIAIDGEPVEGMSQFDLVTKVRGREGTVVDLTMQRGEELLDFSVTRAKITVPTVEYRKIEGNLGYVRLREFSANAVDQLETAFDKLKINQLDGLVLDLRGNPGGLLTTAIDVASLFLEDGVVLVEDFGGGQQRTFETSGTYVGSDVPLVVLVDENSASASELVSGAWQDRERATIVGVTTFGKGTVQTWQQLINGGGVRLTIARWLTPNGHWIHENGVTPDIIVEWPLEERTDEVDPQLNAAIEYLESLVAQPVGSN